MKKLIITTLMISLVIMLSATTNGESGFQMLKISSGADAAALAGTNAINSSDAFSFLQIPTAGLLNPQKNISVTQNYWIFDTTLNSAAYQNSTGKTSFSCAYRFLDYGKLENRDETGGEPNGEFHPMDLVLSANFGYRFTPNHYTGININGLYEKIDSASSLGYTFDFGYSYLPPLKATTISFALKNLGQTSAMDEDVIELPISTEIAFNKIFSFKNMDLQTEIKAIRHFDDDNYKAASGVKALYKKMFALKLGYKFNYDAEDFSYGFGVNYHKFAFDYAFIPFKYEIDHTHILGLTYHF